MPYIIFAEDDTTLRNALTLALKSEGYEVRACADGAEALAAYAERHPDLMILDVMMPKKSGYDVCTENPPQRRPRAGRVPYGKGLR